MKNHDTHIARGKAVLKTEAEALSGLAKTLDASFTTAVETLLSTTGHVVVVGIGKSGHIGRKIAASFASTGTPAFFLHPSEAAHGDLGMINTDATIIALSFSGESDEVNGVVRYGAAQGNRVIAITGRADSTLAKAAYTALILPPVQEACPNRLAPTTSTTLTLAMGDALCVAVMEAKGFSEEEFGRRHPAGKLGFGLQRVAEYLATQDETLPIVAPTTPMSDLILAMTSGGKGCVAVLEKQTLIGIVTDGDLRRNMDATIMQKTAADIMTRDPFSLSPQMRMKDVIASLAERKIGNAFVVDAGKLVGLIDLKTLVATGYV
jgi:arabinose-5-phosphate isomerase